MNVLIACEESQTECIAFRSLGCNAFSCDIQDCSGGYPEWHIKCDVLQILNPSLGSFGRTGISFCTSDGLSHFIPRWDLIIAHPPCTYLSRCASHLLFRGKSLNVDRYEKGLAAARFFRSFFNVDCDHVAIENPIPNKIWGFPPYSQIVQPYHHGHDCSKATCLWLKGLPILFATDICVPAFSYVYGSYSGNRAKYRSKSFSGIASAMADQWCSYLDLRQI